MKNILLIIPVFLLAFTSAIAQESVIEVVGVSQVQVQPDMTSFSYHITSNAKNYNEAVDKLNFRSNKLVQELKKTGFKSEEIKTSNFNIRKNKLYSNGKPSGTEYVASHTIFVKFEYDIKRLLKVLNSTADEEISANLSINFFLSDAKKKSLKTGLLEEAMKDAKYKASTLASVEDYKIAGVKTITHSDQYVPSPRRSGVEFDGVRMMAESSPQQFEPSDMTITETVGVVYFIEK